MEVLIENGAKIKANREGEYPHFVACSSNLFRVFESMLKNGIDINVRNRKGETFLHMLARQHFENKRSRWHDPVAVIIERMAECDMPDLPKFDLYLKDKKGQDFYDVLMKPGYGYNWKIPFDLLKKLGYDTPELDK